MPTQLPGVSCMCLTYGRPELLEEAIHSFLQQDYQGPKELVVLNDRVDQTLKLAHPLVQIVNLRRRVSSLGEKRNVCASLCQHPFLLPWDDDDIYLPHRISTTLQSMGSAPFWNPRIGIYIEGFADKVTMKSVARNYFHSASAFTRELFEQVGGYPQINSGQDIAFEALVEKMGVLTSHKLERQQIYYLYRWNNEMYHLSSFGLDQAKTTLTGLQKVDQYLQRRGVRGGEITLHPQWRSDYPTLARDLLASTA